MGSQSGKLDIAVNCDVLRDAIALRIIRRSSADIAGESWICVPFFSFSHFHFTEEARDCKVQIGLLSNMLLLLIMRLKRMDCDWMRTIACSHNPCDYYDSDYRN